MRFDKNSDFDLLDDCLKIKELFLIPKLHQSTSYLRTFLAEDNINLINSIAIEATNASNRRKSVSAETLAKLQTLSQEVQRLGISDVVTTHTSLVAEREQYRYLLSLDDNRRLAFIEAVHHDPTLAITPRVANFAARMFEGESGAIAQSYIKAIENYKKNLNDRKLPNTHTTEKLSALQRHLKENYPLNVKAPSRHATKKPNSLLSKLKTGTENVAVFLATVAGKPAVKKGLAYLLAAGTLISIGTQTFVAAETAHDINTSSYSAIAEANVQDRLFSDAMTLRIADAQGKLQQYTLEVPTNEEHYEMLDAIDDICSDALSEKVTDAYNEYALKHNLPLAKSVLVQYRDTKDEGPINILRVTDEAGKTYDVSTDAASIFQDKSINDLYDVERLVDDLRSDFSEDARNMDEYQLTTVKQKQIKTLNKNLTKVLDVLSLGFEFDENGFVSKIFNGEEFSIILSNQLDDLQASQRRDNLTSSSNTQTTQQTQDQTKDDDGSR